MPQVIGGEIGNIKEDLWSCGPCQDTTGVEHKDTLARVLMCCATKHDAWETAQDAEKKIVTIKSRKADR